MAIINLTNLSKTDYLPSYYKNNVLIKPIYRQYATVGIGKPNLNTTTFVMDFKPKQDYQIALIQRDGSTSSNPLWAYVMYDDDGEIFTDYENIDYDIYFTLDSLDNSTQTYFTLTTYLQSDMLVNGVIPLQFPLSMYNGEIYKSLNTLTIGNIEIGYVMKNSAVNSYMSELNNSHYEQGYNQGYFDGTSETSSPINNGFGLVGHLFDSVGSLLNHEIMPNITIGGIVSIPIVLTAILVIIKAVK